jgi:hypothetical protein
MNTLCLENYGVSQMEMREMKKANGGFIGPFFGFFLGMYVASLIFG